MTGTWLRHRTATAHADGAAPVVGVASTAVAGFAFWLVAARLYPAAMVGVIVVALSTMQLLTGIAQLNLNQALHRSAAGQHGHRRIGRGYLVSAMLMAAGAVAVVAGASFWAPELLGYAGRVPLLEFFIPATIIWSFFALQDSVVAAAARGGSLPVGNVVLALLKIMLLAIAVVWALQDGSTFAWALAVAAVVACAVGYLFLRALPDREAAPVRQSGLDHAGRLLWSAAVHGLPLLVLLAIGPRGRVRHRLDDRVLAPPRLLDDRPRPHPTGCRAAGRSTHGSPRHGAAGADARAAGRRPDRGDCPARTPHLRARVRRARQHRPAAGAGWSCRHCEIRAGASIPN